MNVTVEKSIACGTVAAPPSKSMAHRALICGALTAGSKIEGIEYSNDISATLDCLKNMGACTATLDCLKNMGACTATLDGAVTLGGLDPFKTESTTLDCRESGSTLRFIIPLCMLANCEIKLTGSDRLFERNLEIYEQIAKQNGILFKKGKNSLTVCGKLKSGSYRVAGNISSQFISGLLFALPLLNGDSELEITGDYESEPYVDLTLKVLLNFGIKIQKCERIYKIAGNQKYTACNAVVEGDYSNAAFLDAFNLIGGKVTVTGLNCNSLQGDRVYRQMYEGLKKGEKHFDLSNCPDLAPVMFALSAVFGGAEFTGTRRLKIKESDRASAMASELKKFGIDVCVYENSVRVCAGKLKKPKEILSGHNDHRIVMALSLLCTLTGGTVSDAQAVAKSYPDYFEKIKFLGIVVKNEFERS